MTQQILSFNVGDWVAGWLGGWVAGWLAGRVIIVPLRGLSCKLRLSRLSAELKFQDRPSVAIVQLWAIQTLRKIVLL